MAHRIIEAIIENGQLKYVKDSLPQGRLKVHLIYDVDESARRKIDDLIRETAGLYRDVDPAIEAAALRKSWERKSWE